MPGGFRQKNSFNEFGQLQCRFCNEWKSIDNFHKNKAISTGYERVCKPCAKNKAAEWRKTHKQSRNRSKMSERSHLVRLKRLDTLRAENTNLKPGWRNALLEFYKNCLKCGSTEKLEADHVIPISKGGLHVAENLQVLCKFCNIQKHSAFVDYRNGIIFTVEKMIDKLNK